MAKSFKTLLEAMPTERREKIEERAQEMLLEMALQQLRQARDLTQEEMATMLKVNQSALSKMEHQTDMRISTLRRLLSAMGGELKLVAHFPDGDVIINQFEEKLSQS